MTKLRVAIVGLAGAALMFALALPALAHPTHATGTTITVKAGSPSTFKFTLSASKAPKGSVTFKVTNADKALQHDFSINGKKTALLSPGKSATLTVNFTKSGKYTYQCTVAGHAAAGMKGTFTVS
jgi:uncharacterized cupredoxin-like copper-binding protein